VKVASTNLTIALDAIHLDLICQFVNVLMANIMTRLHQIVKNAISPAKHATRMVALLAMETENLMQIINVCVL